MMVLLYSTLYSTVKCIGNQFGMTLPKILLDMAMLMQLADMLVHVHC